ncbi:MAG: ABC transporter substrate-binding protein [Planctomycetaceae bacterium]|nr:ABC transporter substrate-binding protein [Planctomycetaceae bacterium]
MRKTVLIVVPALAAIAAAAVFFRAHSSLNRASLPSAAGPTVTLTDLAGRSVTLPARIERIVLIRSRDIYSLSMLLGDEVETKIVAWGPDVQTSDKDAYAKYLHRYPRLGQIPLLGSVFSDAVSVEAVLALKPDLVVGDVFMIERGYKCIEKLQQAAVPIVFTDQSSDPYSGPQRSIAMLGRALGKESRAREIVAFMNQELEKVLSRLGTIKPGGPSVYIESGHLGPSQYGNSYGSDSSGKSTAWGMALSRLPCRNIALGVAPAMGPISAEHLLKSDPDVIVITGANWPAAADTMHLGYSTSPGEARKLLEGFTRRPGWEHLSAVRNRRVYTVFHGFVMHPTFYACVQQMAKWFYPQTFADLDPAASLGEFHKRFMPFECSGTWMLELDGSDR